MNRMLRRFTDSSAAQYIREMERQRQMLEPPGYRALCEWHSKIMPHSLCVNDSLAVGFSNIVGQYDALKLLAAAQYSKHLADNLQKSLQLFRTPALPVIEAFSSSIILAARNLAALRAFEDTFAGQLLQGARDIAEAADDDIPDHVSDIVELLERQIEKSSRGPISIEGWAQIILALLLYISSALNERQMEIHIAGRLSSIEAQLERMAPAEKAEQSLETRIVSATVLRVRAEPSKQAQVIGKLTRNSLVQVLRTQEPWAQVEFFDFIEGKTSTGWVAGRYLRILPKDLVE